eukprot:scaffold111464_cov20-Tisochrysis_lutea.AAC.1
MAEAAGQLRPAHAVSCGRAQLWHSTAGFPALWQYLHPKPELPMALQRTQDTTIVCAKSSLKRKGADDKVMLSSAG